MPSEDSQEIYSTLSTCSMQVSLKRTFSITCWDLVAAKSQTAQSAPKASKKHYLEQTTLIDGEDAFAYRRSDTKRKLSKTVTLTRFG